MVEHVSQRAKVTADFFYFGVTCFYRTSTELSSTSTPAALLLNSDVLSGDKFEAMKCAIQKDMKAAKECGLSVGKNPAWKADGVFELLSSHARYVYIYKHKMYTTASKVLYEQMKTCLVNVEVTGQTEEATCHVHPHHDFLAPFFMDNCALKRFLNARANDVGNDEERKKNITQALSRLEKESVLQDSPYCSPASSANNWEENHWMKRLYHCIKGRDYGEVHFTATGVTFDEVLKILRADEIPKNVFAIRALPDLLFHHMKIVMTTAREDDTDEDEDDEHVSSADEAIEQAHQRNPVKGDNGDGPPKKLGELICSLQVLLTCKYLRRILNNKPIHKVASTKGLFLDKMIASVHVLFQACEEWICDKPLRFHATITEDYSISSPQSTCYHLTKLTTHNN